MLEVVLTKTGQTVELQSYRYEPFWVHCYPDKNARLYRLIPINDYLSDPEQYPDLTAEDVLKLTQFHTDTKKIIEDY